MKLVRALLILLATVVATSMFAAPSARAQQDGVTQYGTVIMEYAGRTERITTLEEQDVTNAIIKLVEGKAKKAGISDTEKANAWNTYVGEGVTPSKADIAALADLLKQATIERSIVVFPWPLRPRILSSSSLRNPFITAITMMSVATPSMIPRKENPAMTEMNPSLRRARR